MQRRSAVAMGVTPNPLSNPRWFQRFRISGVLRGGGVMVVEEGLAYAVTPPWPPRSGGGGTLCDSSPQYCHDMVLRKYPLGPERIPHTRRQVTRTQAGSGHPLLGRGCWGPQLIATVVAG